MNHDKRAVRILTQSYWTAAGWHQPYTLPEDFEYAKSMGVMFDPVDRSHDQAVQAAIKAASAIDSKQVADAFVASLSTRRLDLRSALGSYAVARNMEPHEKVPGLGFRGCAYCGGYDRGSSDQNVLNFERFKWGGVRHSDPQYAALDLELFSDALANTASETDKTILRLILATAATQPEKARLSDLSKALSKLLPSNDAERRTLIGILGYAGILVNPSKPDFRSTFVPWTERQHTRHAKDDWPYPVQWWTGSCGVNLAAVREWFPDL